jgi:hypothetical protein
MVPMQDPANHDPRALDWSTRYLRERWEAGERNGTVLWEELKAKGYTGSSRSVYRRLAKWREHPPKRATPASPGSIPRSPFEDVTPGQVIGWMLARPERLPRDPHKSNWIRSRRWMRSSRKRAH